MGNRLFGFDLIVDIFEGPLEETILFVVLSFDMCILLGVRLDQSFLVRLLLLSVFLLFMGRSFFVTNFLFIFSFCMSLFGSFMTFHFVVSVGAGGMM